MHPLIKIISFLVLVAFIVLGDFRQLVLALLLIIFLAAHTRFANLMVALRMLKRLRWLLLSIFLVYVFLSPGVTWFNQGLGAMDWAGVNHGLMRIFSLVLIVVAVNTLVLPIPREQLVVAIISLLKPLRLLGLSNERLALRIALVLETTPKVRHLYEQQRGLQVETAPKEELTYKQRLQQAGGVFVQTFSMALLKAQVAAEEDIELPHVDRPPWYQWLWPGLIAVAFVLVVHVDSALAGFVAQSSH